MKQINTSETLAFYSWLILSVASLVWVIVNSLNS